MTIQSVTTNAYNSNGFGSSGGSTGIPPSICKNLRISKEGTSVFLNWKDSNNTILDSQYLCTWGGTKIVKKLGSFPQNESDGILVVDNKVMGHYSVVPYTDSIDSAENDWKYAAFPYSTNGAVCYNKLNEFGGAIEYEMIIKSSESYPANKIEYVGENENFSPGRMDFTNQSFAFGSWEDTFILQSFRPCMLKHDGTVDYYLNPNNVKQKLDGSPSDATNTAYAGEVMIEIDQIWLWEEFVNGEWHIHFANKQITPNYDCFTHVDIDNVLKEHYYYAKYQGSVVNNAVRSISGINPTSSLSGVTQRQYCKVHGSHWDSREWSFWRLMLYLHMLIGKTTDARQAFGYGYYTGSTSGYAAKLNGLNDDKGMFYGTQGNTTVTTFFMDDLYCNLWELTQGCIQKQGVMYIKMTPGTYDGSTASDYNTDGTGYLNSEVTVGQSTSAAFIKEMTISPKYGMFPTNCTGASATTYYCNGFWTANVIGFARTGGGCYSGAGLLYGLFALSVSDVASHSSWHSGVSLSFK